MIRHRGGEKMRERHIKRKKKVCKLGKAKNRDNVS